MHVAAVHPHHEMLRRVPHRRWHTVALHRLELRRHRHKVHVGGNPWRWHGEIIVSLHYCPSYWQRENMRTENIGEEVRVEIEKVCGNGREKDRNSGERG